MSLVEFNEVLKGMLQGCGVCPECGCNLLIKKTFYDECFNCNNIVWKPFPKPITKEVRENETQEGNRVGCLPEDVESMVGARSQISRELACWRK